MLPERVISALLEPESLYALMCTATCVPAMSVCSDYPNLTKLNSTYKFAFDLFFPFSAADLHFKLLSLWGLDPIFSF